MTNNLTVTAVTPLEKRTMHPNAAKARGLTEAYESVFVIQGFSDGHIHSPIVVGSRYFRPFTRHLDGAQQVTVLTVLRDDPKNPFQGGDVSKYAGVEAMYENVVRVQRPVAGMDKAKGKPIWTTKELKVTQLVSGKEVTLYLKDVLAWKSGSDPKQAQPGMMVPFSVKAVELTAKEITDHTAKTKQHERVAL